MRVILIRHGETQENVSHILQGHSYGTLTQRGKEQIEKLAKRLASEPIVRILSSDLQRAHYTSERIAVHHKVDLTTHKELRERHLGGFEGGTHETYLREVADSGQDKFTFAGRGCESLMQVVARARTAWEQIVIPAAKEGTVLVSAHGLFNRVLLCNLLGRDARQMFDLEQENTCVNIIERDDDGREKVSLINCVTHLAEGEIARRGITAY